jgi:hypothetical protein
MATESNLVTAANHNWYLYRNDSWSVTLSFKDGDNDPLNLSGVGIEMQVKKSPTATALKSLTIGEGLTVSGGDVTINTIADIPKGSYVWDMQFSYPSGRVVTYLKGVINVTEDVTK